MAMFGGWSSSSKENEKKVARAFATYLQENNIKETMSIGRLREIYRSQFNTMYDTYGVTFSNALHSLCFHLNQCQQVQGKVVFGGGEEAALVMFSDEADVDAEEADCHEFYCKVCKKPMQNYYTLMKHEVSVRHRQQDIVLKIRRSLESRDLTHDKRGVRVTSSPPGDEDGVIEVVVYQGMHSQIVLAVENTGERCVILSNITLLWSTSLFDYSDIRSIDQRKGTLQQGDKELFTIGCKPREEYGYSYVPAVLSFTLDGEEFHILRFLCVRSVSDLYDDLKAKSEYTGPARLKPIPDGIKTEPGIRLPPLKRNGLIMERLESYGIAPSIKAQVKGTKNLSITLRARLEQPLSFTNYKERFSTLIQIEEIQMSRDIRNYDMNGVTFTRDTHGTLLILKVPGLAENRPSVLRGDRLFAYEQGSRQRRYEGIVHAVELLNVKLGFSENMPFITGKKFDVQFTFNRMPVQMQHRSSERLIRSLDMKDVLFPEPSTICQQDTFDVEIRSYFDRNLNEEQKTAVQNIVQGTSRPAPYLIFGPPGTGKTVTFVEAIKQIYELNDDAVILACAPENSAADLIAERLLPHIDKGKIFRMYASSRPWSFVPQKLKDARVVNFDPVTHEVYYPSKEVMESRYRVIVTTLITGGRLVSANFGRGHFTHIFIDEAGHAIEPEGIISIADLLDPDEGQVVLAGDPKQLGPILRSPISQKYGLGLSLLERLMESCKVYKRTQTDYIFEDGEITRKMEYNNKVLTKLVNNYRSHKDIIEIPKNLFYEGELNECAGEFRQVMLGWEELPNPNFPVILHPVYGTDEREEKSPSFFNVAEAETVEKYLKKLLDDRVRSKKMKMIKPEMIGIISPYNRQVRKIQKMVEKRRFGDIKVGSVEEFQGQERRIIIISTVRSTKKEYLDMDKDFNLGFLDNPKRFNVAITRAQALLILIGNPEMLGRDVNWNKFLQFCYDNNGCVNVPPRDSIADIATLMRQLKLLHETDSVAEDDIEISQKELQENPEWTRHE